jgi:chitin disaccharide deacetylase
LSEIFKQSVERLGTPSFFWGSRRVVFGDTHNDDNMANFPFFSSEVWMGADDFAHNAGCSDAIARLASARKIQSTSAMVLSPRWKPDGPMLQPVRGSLSVGLHLDWTSRHALAAGHGIGIAEAMLRAALGRFPLARTQSLVARQLDLFEDVWGAPPDHVDGHQHVHQFAGIREALLTEIARRYPLPRPWVRISNPADGLGSIKSLVIRSQGAGSLQALSERLSIPVMPHLDGIYDFRGGEARYRRLLAHWRQRAIPGTVIMCHPGTANEPGDSHGAARMWEYAVLSAS